MDRLPALAPEGGVAPPVALRVVPRPTVALDDEADIGECEVRAVLADAVLGDRREAALAHRFVQQDLDRREWRQAIGPRSEPEARGDVLEPLECPGIAHGIDERPGIELVELAVGRDQQREATSIGGLDNEPVKASQVGRGPKGHPHDGERGTGRQEIEQRLRRVLQRGAGRTARTGGDDETLAEVVVRVDRPPSLQEGGRIEAGWSPGERAALAGRRGGYRPAWCCGQGSPRWTIGSSAIFYDPAGFA